MTGFGREVERGPARVARCAGRAVGPTPGWGCGTRRGPMTARYGSWVRRLAAMRVRELGAGDSVEAHVAFCAALVARGGALLGCFDQGRIAGLAVVEPKLRARPGPPRGSPRQPARPPPGRRPIALG